MEDCSPGFRPNSAIEERKDHERQAVLQIVTVGFADLRVTIEMSIVRFKNIYKH